MSTESRVFGIGLSRTGTTKLAAVLRELGFDVSDFVVPLFDRDRMGKPTERDWSVLERHDAFTDSPIPLLYRELDDRCPGARFILTTRDSEGWLDSMEWMLTQGRVLWNYGPRVNAYHREIYGTSRFKRAVLEARWRSHHEGVNRYFANRPGDLFIIDISEGFDVPALCDFLGLEHREVDVRSVVNARRKAPLLAHAGYWARVALRNVRNR